MAADSLSQSEIDALFSSGGKERPAPRQAVSTEVRLYDFQRPSRISKEQLRSLHAIYGLVTKGMEGWLAGRIPDTLSIELENVEPLSFGEFTLALPSPCASYILSLGKDTGAAAVVEVGRDLAFHLFDRFLGGAGEVEVPNRSLSLVERAVIQVVVDRMAFQLKEAWQDHVPIDPIVAGFEAVPEMLQVTSPEEPVLVTHLKVRVEDLTSSILICLPFPALERFFSGGGGRKLTAARGTEAERGKERSLMSTHITRAGLDVSAHFPVFDVPLGLIAGLAEGDLLTTGFAPDTDLEIRVAGRPRYRARAGRKGQYRAISIQGMLSTGAPTTSDEA